MGNYLLIIDGSSLLTTQFFGNLPREIIFAKTTEEKEVYFPKIMQTSEGIYTNAIYGFMRTILKIRKEQKPKYIAVAWDLTRDTFRREMYPDYKGNRGDTLAPLKQQFELCQEVLKNIGIPQFMDMRFEADDFAGTLTTMFENQVPVRIMTKDHDYLQLVSENTELWMIHSTAKKTEELYEKYGMNQRDYDVPDRTFPFNPELVLKEFGVKPASVNSLKGLQGDTSDNIKGVPGIGEMTAVALIHEYETVENLYETIKATDDKGRKALADYWKTELGIKRSPMATLLKESDTELVGEKAAILSKTLATIKRDIPLDITLADLEFKIDVEAAKQEFTRLQFKSLKVEDADSDGFEKVSGNPFESADGDGFVTVSGNPFENTDGDGFAAVSGNPFVNTDGEGTSNPFENVDAGISSSGKNAIAVGRDGHATSPECKIPAYHEAAELVEVVTLNEINTNISDYLAFQVLAGADGSLNIVFQNSSNRQELVTGVSAEAFVRFLQEQSENRVKLVTLGLKDQLDGLDTEALYGLVKAEKISDIKLAAYLVNPLTGAYDYFDLAKAYYDITLPDSKELFGKMTITEAMMFETAKVRKMLSLRCNMAYLTADYFLKLVEAKGMERLYRDVEMPLVFTLYAMQQRGIRLQEKELADYAEQLGVRINALEKEIYTMAGEEFNINSPKQLGVILFEKLELPGGKKTKTGYSTAADVLERLKDQNEIVGKILEYRQLTKLKSTYADALGDEQQPDGRIHGQFHQTITATGRISSTNPNLQNIPIRMEAGRQLRRVFVPEDGFIFVDADYSQIELRVLAHMSGDSRLIAAYNEAEDIHRITASQVFHTPFDEVTSEQRSRAKAVNFGIVYGISAFGLGQDLNISQHEAEDYRQAYFETYPRVKDFMDELVANGRKEGESRTMLGRIRPLPDISSTNFMKRSAEERVAMNAPIQGTAADIMKIAMIRVDRRLIEGGFQSRLLLQIHDELLIETAESEKDAVMQLVEEEMSKALELAVPLEVAAKAGKNWLEAH